MEVVAVAAGCSDPVRAVGFKADAARVLWGCFDRGHGRLGGFRLAAAAAGWRIVRRKHVDRQAGDAAALQQVCHVFNGKTERVGHVSQMNVLKSTCWNIPNEGKG